MSATLHRHCEAVHNLTVVNELRQLASVVCWVSIMLDGNMSADGYHRHRMMWCFVFPSLITSNIIVNIILPLCVR